MKRTRAPGFTLIEVLVALAIVAVALSAGMRALAQGADGASSLKARTLALWVAENRLARAQLDLSAQGATAASGDETRRAAPSVELRPRGGQRSARARPAAPRASTGVRSTNLVE